MEEWWKNHLETKRLKALSAESLVFYGWVIRIRTLIDGVRVRSPAIGRSPNELMKSFIHHGCLGVNRIFGNYFVSKVEYVILKISCIIPEFKEDTMPIKVLIRRKIPENRRKELYLLFVEMRARAMKQEGYIGGETLKRVDSQDDYLVISRWQRVEDWSRWLVSSERQEIQEQINALINTEARFEIYEHI